MKKLTTVEEAIEAINELYNSKREERDNLKLEYFASLNKKQQTLFNNIKQLDYEVASIQIMRNSFYGHKS